MTIEIPRFLTEAQVDLIRETEPHRMEQLDEDALLELHTRVRRARSSTSSSIGRQEPRGSA